MSFLLDLRPVRPLRLVASFLVGTVLLCGSPGTLAAQAASAAVLPVQVASLKQNRSGDGPMQIDRGMAITRVVNATANQLIEAAYGLEAGQIAGGPAWVSTIHYDLTYAGGALSSAGTTAALQQILSERFHLLLKQESRSTPVYALVVAASGKKFKEAAPQQAQAAAGPGPLSQLTVKDGRGELISTGSITALADTLRAKVDRPVLDRTGLTGTYAIAFHWTNDGTSAKLLSEELQEQLGLELVPQQADLPACTIQQIEQPVETTATATQP